MFLSVGQFRTFFPEDKKNPPKPWLRWIIGSGVLGFLQGLRQLVGAGSSLHTTADTLDTGDDLVDFATFHECGDALQITVAASNELNIGDFFVLDIKEDLLRAGAFGLVFVMHGKASFLY